MNNNRRRPTRKDIPVLSEQDIVNAFQPWNPADEDELGDDDFDYTLDIAKRDGREYKIEINWDQFDEPQIQMLIAILFQSMGYSSENWHESDRAREDGADLVIQKPKSKDKIAIAVKVKPKNEDRPQLLDLSKRKEKTKVYVYIQTPSGKFRDNMCELEGIIDFWNKEKLNKFFVENNLGFTVRLIFDGHKISQTIDQVQQILFKLRQDCLKLRKGHIEPIDSQSFKWLIRLKDEGVSLHKTNANVITLLDKPINFKNVELNEHFIKLFLEYFHILDLRLTSFLHYFDLFYARNAVLVNNSVIENSGRSHWLHLLQYQSDNSLLSLKKELKDAIANEASLKIIRKKYPNKALEHQFKEWAKNNDVWEVMTSRVRNFMIFGAGIEAVVDDIVDEYAEILPDRST